MLVRYAIQQAITTTMLHGVRGPIDLPALSEVFPSLGSPEEALL